MQYAIKLLLILYSYFQEFKLNMDSKNAQKTWEMSNSVEAVNTADDIYRYDKKQQQDILAAKPWEKE